MKFEISNFQANSNALWLWYLCWNSPPMTFTGPYLWWINIGSGNGVVPSGNKPLPERVDPDLCHHMASLGHNKLTHCPLKDLDVILESVFFKPIYELVSWAFYVKLIPQNPIDDKSTLVQVMAWYCQATSHYLNQLLTKIYVAIWHHWS